MAAPVRLLPVLLLPLSWAQPGACTDTPDGGWLAGTVLEEPRCTVERADASLTYSLFLQRYGGPGTVPAPAEQFRFAFSRPVILGGVTDNSVSVPSPLHPGEAAGGLRALAGAAQHGQHLLVPQSGRAVPGVRGAPAEAAGPGPAGQRHPLLLRGQQLHRVGPPLPALRAPSVPHPGNQPRLQLWDRRLRLWRSLSLARPWFLRSDFWQEALVSVPAG